MHDYSQSIHQRITWSRIAYRFLDVFSIFLGWALVVNYLPDLNSKATLIVALVTIGIFNIVGELVGLYRNWQAVAFERETTCCLITFIFTMLGMATIGHVSQYTTELSGNALLLWFCFTPVVSLASRVILRVVLRWMISRGIHSRSFAIVGVNELGIQLVRNVNNAPEQQLNFLGFFDDRPQDRTKDLPEDINVCLLYTSPSPRDRTRSRMPSSA